MRAAFSLAVVLMFAACVSVSEADSGSDCESITKNAATTGCRVTLSQCPDHHSRGFLCENGTCNCELDDMGTGKTFSSSTNFCSATTADVKAAGNANCAWMLP